jgi:ribosome biogenesis GTPase
MSLSELGWDERVSAAAAACPNSGNPARVVFESRSYYRLETGEGEVTARWMPGKMDRPVTGDWVLFEPSTSRIAALVPRRNSIIRKRAGRESGGQVLAANVDVAFLVAGLDGDFNLRRIERYLLAVTQAQCEPVVVLNKTDLCADPMECLRQVDRITGGVVPVVLISALDAGSVMALHRYVQPVGTAVLLGSSGVGKSTIVNALLGDCVQPVNEVRAGDSRGRHTTTARRLFRVSAGWLLLDTPGLRELAPSASPDAVEQAFADIAEAARDCRFRDCRHQGEPGCAVAVSVDQKRIASYRKIQAELARLERMQDATAAAEEKRRWKAIHREIRRMPDKRR